MKRSRTIEEEMGLASDDTNTPAHDGSPLPSGIEKGEDA